MQNKFLKKTLSSACAAAISLSAFAGMTFSASAEEKIFKGDINADGSIDISDVVSSRADIVGNKILDDASRALSDVNCDDILNISDVVKIRHAVVTPEFTYEDWLNGTIAIESYNRFEEEIEIPEEIDGKKVSEVAFDAFDNSPWFANQPDGLISLDGWCLGYKGEMPKNYELVFPDDIRKIAVGAFIACENLSKVTFNEGMSEVPFGAFMMCPNIKSVDFSSSITKIGMAAFSYCESLNNFTIPDSITNVEFSAFDGTGWFEEQPDGLLSKDGWILTMKYSNEEASDDISFDVPDGTKGLFSGFVQLCQLEAIELYIPASVNYINDSDLDLLSEIVGEGEGFFTPDPGFSICGEAGSVAEAYANSKGITFNVLS